MRIKLNEKIGLTVLIFSVVITLVIVSGFFAWQRFAGSAEVAANLGSDIVIINNADREMIEAEQEVNINRENLINTAEFDHLYYQSIFNRLPMIVFLICFLIIIASFFLWLFIRRIYTQQMLAIIEEIQYVKEDQEISLKEAHISRALNQLRESFSEKLEDYKRLSSYLTHDQKNTIAVLRANLEQKAGTEEELALLDHLTNSVDDILTLTSDATETTEIVDVAMIVAEVCDSYRKLYPKIEFEFDELAETRIVAKDRWIQRAVSNLLSNAIKYGENNTIFIDVKQHYQSVVITVRDQGLGMDEGEHSKVFNHKYRVKGLQQDGYGIGLSVVRHVCDLCQGYIFVESKKNVGSTFYLSFPLA